MSRRPTKPTDIDDAELLDENPCGLPVEFNLWTK
jgi:hypothetical protein